MPPTKQQVLDTYRGIPADLKNPAPLLTKASGFAFYNISRYHFDVLVPAAAMAPALAAQC